MSLGTEKINKIVDALGEVAKIGKQVAEDKKVSIEDLPAFVAFFPKIPEVISAFKDLGEAVEEGKDIDVAEVVGLIQKIHAKVKEIEAA
jgi:hypothetical protein